MAKRRSVLAVLLLALAGFGACLAPVAASAQTGQSNSIDSRVAAMLAAFPTGGPGLRAAVAKAVEADLNMVQLLLVAAQSETAAQKQAIGAGLADALAFFRKLGTAGQRAAAVLLAVMRGADVETRLGFLLATDPAFSKIIPYFDTAGGITTNSCTHVSPASPKAGLHPC